MFRQNYSSNKGLMLNVKAAVADQISQNLLALIHCGEVMHICTSKLAIIGPDNAAPPVQWQVIIRNNANLLIRPLWTNLS